MKQQKKHPGKNSAAAAPAHERAAFSPRVRSLLLGVFLIMATVLVYQPVWHAGFIWDDDCYVTSNQTLHDLPGLKEIWFDTSATPQYYPLVHTSFWLEYHAWGLHPLGYHVVNVLLHALGSILLWRVLVRLALPGAWLAGAIFALHPVNVESVAWITERKNVLSAVLFFAAALAYLRFDGQPENKKRPWGWWCAAGLLFLGALLSKTVACSLPAALLLVCWWKKKRVTLADILPLVPFFVIGLCLGLQTAWLEKHHVGASGADWSLSFAERCLVAGRALWFYAGKLVWPAQLTFIYPHWHIETGTGWQWLFPAAALGIVALLWRARARIGRGPLVAVLFFAGTLFPALGFFNLYPMRYTFVADHYQYLASVGMIVLVAAGLAQVMGRWKGRRPFLKPALCGLLLLTLGTLTWRQSRMYADLETLWRATIDRNPASWLAHNNLGGDLLQQNRLDEAMAHFHQAIEIEPGYPEAHNNLGDTLVRKGSEDEGIREFRQSLSNNPDYVEAHNNLGMILLQKGQTDEAMAHLQRALVLKPEYAAAHYNLGNAWMQKGQLDEAIRQFQSALASQPDYAEAHINLGNALLQAGRTDEAIVHFQKALGIQPGIMEAHYNLGTALFRQGQPDAAIRQFQEALAIRPDSVEAHHSLAAVLHQKGRVEEALMHLQRAQELAQSQNNTALAKAIEEELKIYRWGPPGRDLPANH